jgi:hypothetical protein
MNPAPTKTGKQAIGGNRNRESDRHFLIKSRELVSNEQGYPARVWWGKTRLAGDVITPVFNIQKRPAPVKGGGKGGGKAGGAGNTSFLTSASYAVFLGLGLCSKLTGIKNGDTDIWTGDIDNTSADSHGRTVLDTSIGAIHFYWGFPDQDQDEVLNNLYLDDGAAAGLVPIPNYKNCCYAVMHDVEFGEQDVQPTLHFYVARHNDVLTLSAHSINGDAVMSEVIYDLLTNRLYGGGLDPARIDKASFEACGEQIITEGLGTSPVLEDHSQGRQLIGDLMEYLDGVIYFNGSKFVMKLMRPQTTVGIQAINESHLMEEPDPTNTQYDDTWSDTRISFTDRLNKWEDAAEPWYDEANAEIVGERRTKTFNLKYITTQKIAKKVARRKGKRNGIPHVGYRLTLKPSVTILPEEIFFLTYAATGINGKVMHAQKVTRGGSLKPELVVECIEEPALESTDDYEPPDDFYAFAPIVDSSGSGEFAIMPTTARVAVIPNALKEGFSDGFLVVMNRTDSFISRHKTFFTFDPLQQEFALLEGDDNFPAAGTILFWQRMRGGTGIHLRIQFDATNFAMAAALGGDYSMLAVTGKRSVKTEGYTLDRHEVDSLWYRQQVNGLFQAWSATVFDIELVPGQYGNGAPVPESDNAPGEFPPVSAYLGRLDDFTFVRSNEMQFERSGGNAPVVAGGPDPDAGRVRHVKVTLANQVQEESVADAVETTYARLDTTMAPLGTYTPDWGARARLAPEIFDLSGGNKLDEVTDSDYGLMADIDAGLGAIYNSAPSTTESLISEDSNSVLGQMVTVGDKIYNWDYPSNYVPVIPAPYTPGTPPVSPGTVTVAAQYFILANDDTIFGDTTAGGFNVWLPSPIGIPGKTYTIKNIGSGLYAGRITVLSPDGYILGSSENGLLPVFVASLTGFGGGGGSGSLYGTVQIKSDGTRWILL